MTWTIKQNGRSVAHAAPPAVSVQDDGSIEVVVGAYTVVMGRDTAPLKAAAVSFCRECEAAARVARLTAAATS